MYVHIKPKFRVGGVYSQRRFICNVLIYLAWTNFVHNCNRFKRAYVKNIAIIDMWTLCHKKLSAIQYFSHLLPESDVKESVDNRISDVIAVIHVKDNDIWRNKTNSH